jgi:hypothetical protein
MASDRLVTSQHVLKAVMEYDRRGATAVLSELETLEPDLVEYLLETLSRIFHGLSRTTLSDKQARAVYRQARKTAVVCIMALRQAHHDLWDKDGDEPPKP